MKLQDCTPPPNQKSCFSPSLKMLQPRNSDLRGRSPGVIRKNIQTDRSSERTSLSPFRNSSGIRQKRNSKLNNIGFEESGGSNLYKITPTRQKIWEGMENERPSV